MPMIRSLLKCVVGLALVCGQSGCATQYLYDDQRASSRVQMHVLVAGQQTVLVSRNVCYLTYGGQAYALTCSYADFQRADGLLIWLDQVGAAPTRYQLNAGDRYVESGAITTAVTPLLYSWDSIPAQVVSVHVEGIKPKSIYFKLAMTPFAIAMDASLLGGVMMGSAAANPLTVAGAIQSASR